MNRRWSMSFVIAAVALAAPATSQAEGGKVKASQEAKVFARRGERAKVLVTLPKGASAKLLATQGRWVKVRYKSMTGWIPRTLLEMPDAEVSRNTRRRPFVDGRGTKRGFGGEEGPDDRVGADATVDRGTGDDEGDDEGDEGDDEADDPPPTAGKKPPPKTVATKTTKPDPDDEDVEEDESEDPSGEGRPEEEEDTEAPRKSIKVAGKTSIYEDPDEESDVSFTADAKMALYPLGERKGKYILVENDEGDVGYILESDVEAEEDLGEGGDDDDDDAPIGKRRRHIDLKARLGVTILQQGMRTTGGGEGIPNNYNLTTSAATIALGGTVLIPKGERLVIGGDLAFDAAANTGITIMAGAPATKIQLYNFNARGVVGYDLRKKSGMMVFGRLGLRYESFQVSNVGDLTKNAGKLPSEIVIAPTLGAALALPRLTEKIGLRFSLDAVLFGASVKQTKRLEDGANPSAKGVVTGVGLTYNWKDTFWIQAAYDLTIFSKSFGAPVMESMRQHDGMSSTRSDLFHQATVGVARAF